MVKRKRPGWRQPEQKCPQRGRRYTAEQKAEALAWAAKHGTASAAAKFGMSQRTVDYWQAAQRKGQASEAGGLFGRTAVAAGRSSASAPAVTAPPAVKASRVARARRGRRYGVAEKQAILDHAAAHGATATERALGVSRWSINEWRRRQTAAPTVKEAAEALQPRSSRPKRNAQKLSEERHHVIAETWLQNQALGPRQVRQLLRRTHALRVGTSTVRRVMEEQGYVPPKIKVERRSASRYEAVRPNQQWHFDFVHFFLHKVKLFLLLLEDDFSRFLPGWALCEGERAEPVVAAFDTAIARHGKPEQIVVDGGSGFFSWRGESQLERACGDYGIDFIKASKRGSNSKLEALNANVRKELLSRVEFDDVADARFQIARWVRGYNFDRVHEGLGGLLVPADRHFGRTDEVLAQIERGDPVVVPGPLPPDARTLELFRVVSRGGRPELWLLGERVWPAALPAPPEASA
jgi:transposase InsO family protein